MKLYEPFVMSVEYKGRTYRLTPWFDRVLRVYDIFADKTYTDTERLDVALSLLVRGKYPLDAGLLNAIFDALIVVKDRGGGTDIKPFDYAQDAPYIYAAFRQVYGIDLYNERGRLHWQAFVAMFLSLPADTRIMEIISIRTRKIPRPTQYNAEERAELMRQKALYALELTAEEREANLQRGLRNMALALKAMAAGGEKHG